MMSKEFKVVHNNTNNEITAKQLTEFSKEGWEVVSFTDHLTLLTREVKGEELITEG